MKKSIKAIRTIQERAKNLTKSELKRLSKKISTIHGNILAKIT